MGGGGERFLELSQQRGHREDESDPEDINLGHLPGVHVRVQNKICPWDTYSVPVFKKKMTWPPSPSLRGHNTAGKYQEGPGSRWSMPNTVYEKDDLGSSAQEGFLEEEACDLGLWGRVEFK